MSGELVGRTALITGASHGLGLEMARHFLRAGALGVTICGRSAGDLEAASAELRQMTHEGQVVHAELADVSSQEDVERLVKSTLDNFPELTILVNNAGVYGPKGEIGEVGWEEWVRAVQINLFGSVLVARGLTSHFKAQGYGKVIQLSGGGATKPMPHLSAYATSKAAVIRFAETLAEELRGARVDVNAIAPGALNTRMLDEILTAGPGPVGAAFYAEAQQQAASGGTPLERGAALAVWLASAASDGISGKLLSAPWDPWAQLPERRGYLAGDV
ncbi:MAG: SDR family NAD(P)-dependent oxidoreductase, partial [Solirubrobacteraceae bacterium]